MEWLLNLSGSTLILSQLGEQAKAEALRHRARGVPESKDAGSSSSDSFLIPQTDKNPRKIPSAIHPSLASIHSMAGRHRKEEANFRRVNLLRACVQSAFCLFCQQETDFSRSIAIGIHLSMLHHGRLGSCHSPEASSVPMLAIWLYRKYSDPWTLSSVTF